jgi:PilZ domain
LCTKPNRPALDTSVTFYSGIYPDIIYRMASQARLRSVPGGKASPERAVFRRWQRYRLNLPIRLIFTHDGTTKIMSGRGNDMSEGGVLVFAGMELKTGDEVLIEFTPPFAEGPVRVRGLVRHRRGYNYGIEFALETKEEQDQTEKFRGMLRLAAGNATE